MPDHPMLPFHLATPIVAAFDKLCSGDRDDLADLTRVNARGESGPLRP
jgi:hypothetical protein